MTYQIYSQSNLAALTIAAIKAIATQIGAIPDGDKRVKQSWVSAVLDHQIKLMVPHAYASNPQAD